MTTDLAELERRALARARARAGGDLSRTGHIVCSGLVRIFKTDGVEVVALQGLELTVDRGELTAIVGASGSGKSTLLNILSGLDIPTAGEARVGDHDLLAMGAAERLRFRRRTVGFVWQQTGRNLLPYLSAVDNVTLPMRLAGQPRRQRRTRALELLDLVGAAELAGRLPEQMSGGEQQRTAVAVALANDPEVLFADEPTGELDEVTAERVFEVLQTANAELGVTVLVVTHDPGVATRVRRTVSIRDGRTAAEVHRARRTVDGTEHLVTEEYAVLDRTGRLQLPADFVGTLRLRDRVRLTLQPDHVQVRPAVTPGNAPDRPTADAAPSPSTPRTDTGQAAQEPDGRRTPGSGPLLRIESVSHTYQTGQTVVTALREASLTVNQGELLVVRGRSGAGKTTLLNVLGGLMRPTSGQVFLGDEDVTAASESRLLELRRSVIGFVFQSFGLIPILSAAENIGVPLRLNRMPADEREQRVAVLLELVGLGEHAAQRPYELSGGQQQRVAIARALAAGPQLLIADEPTGQLDSETGRSIMELLRALVTSSGTTVLVATHDPSLIELADRTLVLRDGQLSPG